MYPAIGVLVLMVRFSGSTRFLQNQGPMTSTSVVVYAFDPACVVGQDEGVMGKRVWEYRG